MKKVLTSELFDEMFQSDNFFESHIENHIIECIRKFIEYHNNNYSGKKFDVFSDFQIKFGCCVKIIYKHQQHRAFYLDYERFLYDYCEVCFNKEETDTQIILAELDCWLCDL